ncbi:hypothetical protein PN441_04000 [Spirulina major CS-329]|jgi:hypothetical protein|uniref:arginine synthesis PII-interacting regulator PirA n=1 Tax=Spirulina TaxID=1154 RepID=UPI00232E23B3|nr:MULTISPECIES: hypothetical protein [Spirulina]MDB9494010.1 hypothetical protein [Spirulina subsalsa CS-330]MDB9502222.1 hypothetical protein [Spirulina major CS-329]
MLNQTRKEVLRNTAANHRDNLRKSLQQRLESARSSGNEDLVKQLEAEAEYLGMN